MNQVLGTDKILRLNNFSLVGLVQSLDWNPEFQAQTINELGRDNRVDVSYELETRGSFELMSSGNTAGMLARMKVERTAGAFTGYQYDAGVSKNAYTFTQTDLKEMEFDLVIHEKPDQVNYSRSVWIPRAMLTSFSGRADSNGMASETYNWSGQFAEAFKTPFHDIASVPATRASATQIELTDAAITDATHTLAYVMVDDRVFTTKVTDATYFTFDVGVETATLTTTEGYTIPAGAVCRALVYKTTGSTTFPVLSGSDRGTTASFVKGYQANIYIAPTVAGAPTQNEKWLKVQNASWDVNLRAEALRQISRNAQGTSIFARVPTFPIDISASFSVFESDWADWKVMMTKSFAGGSVYDNSYTFAPKTLKSSFAIVVEFFAEDAGKVQTWTFEDMYLDGAGNRVNVGGRAEMSWSMKGSKFTLTGLDA